MHTNSEVVTDKNSQRWMLMKVLRRLWQQPAAWSALQSLAGAEISGGEAGGKATAAAPLTDFGEFATTLVKENIFLLDDALGACPSHHSQLTTTLSTAVTTVLTTALSRALASARRATAIATDVCSAAPPPVQAV